MYKIIWNLSRSNKVFRVSGIGGIETIKRI